MISNDVGQVRLSRPAELARGAADSEASAGSTTEVDA